MQQKITGIYKITNIANNKIYIGSSQNINRRIKEHIRNLKKNTHENNYLQKAWNKYGQENFLFEIVEETNIENVLILEQKYLDSLKPYDENIGYNLAMFAYAPMRGKKHTPEAIKKQIEKQSGKNHWTYGKPKHFREKLIICDLTVEQQQEIIKEFLNTNIKTKDILIKYNICKTSFYKILNRNNINIRKKIFKINENIIDIIKNEFLNGLSRRQIRQKYNFKKTTVYNATRNLTQNTELQCQKAKS